MLLTFFPSAFAVSARVPNDPEASMRATCAPLALSVATKCRLARSLYLLRRLSQLQRHHRASASERASEGQVCNYVLHGMEGEGGRECRGYKLFMGRRSRRIGKRGGDGGAERRRTRWASERRRRRTKQPIAERVRVSDATERLTDGVRARERGREVETKCTERTRTANQGCPWPLRHNCYYNAWVHCRSRSERSV